MTDPAADYVAAHHDIAAEALWRAVELPAFRHRAREQLAANGWDAESFTAWLLEERERMRRPPPPPPPAPLLMHPAEIAWWTERLGHPPPGCAPSEPIETTPPDDGPVRLVVAEATVRVEGR